MKPLRFFGLAALLLAACAPAQPTPTPAPLPAPGQPATPAIREAARNWQLLDPVTDSVPGIGAERAYAELLAGRQPSRTVIVAVIDGGVDSAHADLTANLWTNADEQPGNDRDDDANGYTDDVRGWNFIGGADGESVRWDTFEVTRLFALCTESGRRPGGDTLSTANRARCPEISADYDRRRSEAEQILQNVLAADAALSEAVRVLQQAVGGDSLSVARVTALQPSGGDARRARQLYLQLAADGLTPEIVSDARESYEAQIRYGYNPTFEPRAIVGDDYTDVSERRYGNPDTMGPDAEHGTHVAGIIGAVRGNGVGVDGVASAVRIMSIRTVPDGDERDKDVANAIRYAVDNGAHIINMSFGKAYSPQKAVVDAAVRYADSAGVLIVHAAGNDGADIGESPSFPSATYLGGGRAANWIEVGASSWKGGDSLVAPFSNYGATEVDVFAPGVDIRSAVPGGGYERNSGTSMAAPVVSGVAAMLMAYFPNLTAADVKRIILTSATSYANQRVVPPGDARPEPVLFGALSATGGIVNAYAAVRMAQEMATKQ